MVTQAQRRNLSRNQSEARRQNTVEAAPQDTQVMGRVLVKGSGEVLVDVNFPVTFSEKPLPILGGAELTDGHNPVTDSFPKVNSTVINWDTFMGESGNVFYTGAKLSIVVVGAGSQHIWSTYAFTGSALTNAGNAG